MTKEQQIAELASILCIDYGNGNGCQLSYNGSCDTCGIYDDAETIYAAGYRKQGEGEWLTAGMFDDFLKCSVCGSKHPLQTAIEYKYCPHCGARMKRIKR